MKRKLSPNKDKRVEELREFLKRKHLKSIKYSVDDLSKILNRSKQSIYSAINARKLKAKKDVQRHCWMINSEDLREYIRCLYNRDLVKNSKGQYIFDSNKNKYSIKTISKKLNINPQRVYYAIRNNLIPFKTYNNRYILHVADEKKFLEKILRSKYKKIRMAS